MLPNIGVISYSANLAYDGNQFHTVNKQFFQKFKDKSFVWFCDLPAEKLWVHPENYILDIRPIDYLPRLTVLDVDNELNIKFFHYFCSELLRTIDEKFTGFNLSPEYHLAVNLAKVSDVDLTLKKMNSGFSDDYWYFIRENINHSTTWKTENKSKTIKLYLRNGLDLSECLLPADGGSIIPPDKLLSVNKEKLLATQMLYIVRVANKKSNKQENQLRDFFKQSSRAFFGVQQYEKEWFTSTEFATLSKYFTFGPLQHLVMFQQNMKAENWVETMKMTHSDNHIQAALNDMLWLAMQIQDFRENEKRGLLSAFLNAYTRMTWLPICRDLLDDGIEIVNSSLNFIEIIPPSEDVVVDYAKYDLVRGL